MVVSGLRSWAVCLLQYAWRRHQRRQRRSRLRKYDEYICLLRAANLIASDKVRHVDKCTFDQAEHLRCYARRDTAAPAASPRLPAAHLLHVLCKLHTSLSTLDANDAAVSVDIVLPLIGRVVQTLSALDAEVADLRAEARVLQRQQQRSVPLGTLERERRRLDDALAECKHTCAQADVLREQLQGSEARCESLRQRLAEERDLRQEQAAQYERKLEKLRVEVLHRRGLPNAATPASSHGNGSGRGHTHGHTASARGTAGGSAGAPNGPSPPSASAGPRDAGGPAWLGSLSHSYQTGRVRAIDLVRQLDSDGDGVVSKLELHDALAAAGVGDEDIDAAFAAVDADGSGSISVRELSRVLRDPGGARRDGGHQKTGGRGTSAAGDARAASASPASTFAPSSLAAPAVAVPAAALGSRVVAATLAPGFLASHATAALQPGVLDVSAPLGALDLRGLADETPTKLDLRGLADASSASAGDVGRRVAPTSLAPSHVGRRAAVGGSVASPFGSGRALAHAAAQPAAHASARATPPPRAITGASPPTLSASPRHAPASASAAIASATQHLLPQYLRAGGSGASAGDPPPRTPAAALAGSSAAAMVEQLRGALQSQLSRVMDLFRSWDVDGDGRVDRREFARGIKTLGLASSMSAAAELFDSLDADGSGTVEFHELHALLRRARSPPRRAAVSPPHPLEKAGEGWRRLEKAGEGWRRLEKAEAAPHGGTGAVPTCQAAAAPPPHDEPGALAPAPAPPAPVPGGAESASRVPNGRFEPPPDTPEGHGEWSHLTALQERLRRVAREQREASHSAAHAADAAAAVRGSAYATARSRAAAVSPGREPRQASARAAHGPTPQEGTSTWGAISWGAMERSC